jgi:hypothetical protein
MGMTAEPPAWQAGVKASLEPIPANHPVDGLGLAAHAEHAADDEEGAGGGSGGQVVVLTGGAAVPHHF